MTKNERNFAIKLVHDVFMQFEAPDYPEEGIKTFEETAIYNDDFLNNLEIFGCYIDKKIIGVIATRKEGNHIALFFVDREYHRQGIGKKLFHVVLEHSTLNEITVNSSPYAKEVYHHLGFVDTDDEKVIAGMRFTPMVYRKEEGEFCGRNKNKE